MSDLKNAKVQPRIEQRFRVVWIDADGKRRQKTFDSIDEALELYLEHYGERAKIFGSAK